MDERRSRSLLWMWVGSVMIALLIVGALTFGVYRLYAFGFARGAAAIGGEAPVELTGAPLMPVPGAVAHRAGRFPVLGLFLGLFLIGGLVRHLAWGRYSVWARRCEPGPWGWLRHYPGYGWDAPGYPNEHDTKGEAEVSA